MKGRTIRDYFRHSTKAKIRSGSASFGNRNRRTPPLLLEPLESRTLLTVGTWTKLINLAPNPISTMMMLSDGTVMCLAVTQAAFPDDRNATKTWYRLTPDVYGCYSYATWSSLPSMHDTRYIVPAQVLKDGRVFVAGGEFGTG
jgi:hypothetical protein